MEIRKLNTQNESEMKHVFQLQIAAYKVEAAILDVDSLPPLKETYQDFKNSIEEVFILLVDFLPIGAIFLEKSDALIVISKLFVKPKFFRQGIGRKLVEHSLATYPNLVYQVQTGAENNPALQLYRKFGFNVFEEIVAENNIKITKLQRVPHLFKNF